MKKNHDSETLAEGKQVFTAVALIHRINNGKREVFLPKRAKTKKFLPDVFELPGGHIDYGEEMISGLKREVREEFGVNISVGDPFAAFTYVNDIKRSHSIEVIYFAEFDDPENKITLYPEDHSEFIWVSLDDIDQAYSANKPADDIEFVCIRKGLRILDGEQPDYSGN